LFPVVRAEVLRLLFTNPGQELYARELARLSFLALRTIQDEVAKLEAANLIVSRSNGYQRFYHVNPKHPLYAERVGIFATTMLALGIAGLSKGHFTVKWQPVPRSFPGREVLVYLCALISLASGVGLLWQRTAAIAARVLLFWFLLWLLFLRLPGFSRGFRVDVYWAACQTAVMLAAAWVLYTWFATDWDKQRLGFVAGENGLRIARVLYGLALIPLGLAHFTYLKQTAVLVPGWLPWHVAWACLTGATFIAAGSAILIGVWARLAAALSTLQMGLFFLLVWIPRVAEGSLTAFQWGETVVTWALMSAGWVLTDSYCATPWLAVKSRPV
jgi:uncharacterized membrane protein